MNANGLAVCFVADFEAQIYRLHKSLDAEARNPHYSAKNIPPVGLVFLSTNSAHRVYDFHICPKYFCCSCPLHKRHLILPSTVVSRSEKSGVLR